MLTGHCYDLHFITYVAVFANGNVFCFPKAKYCNRNHPGFLCAYYKYSVIISSLPIGYYWVSARYWLVLFITSSLLIGCYLLSSCYWLAVFITACHWLAVTVYSADMPQRLPLYDIVSGLLKSVGKALKYWFHYTLVAIAWLGVVPLTACKYPTTLFLVIVRWTTGLDVLVFSCKGVLKLKLCVKDYEKIDCFKLQGCQKIDSFKIWVGCCKKL